MTTNSLRVLVLAHVFPRTRGDSMGAFLLHLADALVECNVQTDIVAPHAQNLANDETIGAAHVHRFRYAPARWEQLAYKGTMHELVAGGITNKILFAMFNFAFLLKAIAVARAAHAHRLQRGRVQPFRRGDPRDGARGVPRGADHV